MDPIRERRESWSTKKKEIREILDKGASRAREVAGQTLREALKAMGLV
jgi:hypothetical protein